MKKRICILFVSTLLSVPTSILLSKQDTPVSHNTEPSTNSSPQDATQEVNVMDNLKPVTSDEDAKEMQAILNHFSGIIGNFFNIIQDPNNPKVVGPSIANMIGGMINIVVEAVKNDEISPTSSQKEITRYIKTLQNNRKLTKSFIKIIIATKNAQNNNYSSKITSP